MLLFPSFFSFKNTQQFPAATDTCANNDGYRSFTSCIFEKHHWKRIRNTISILVAAIHLALIFHPNSEAQLFGNPAWTGVFFTIITVVIFIHLIRYAYFKKVSSYEDFAVLLFATVCHIVMLPIYIVRLHIGSESLTLSEITFSFWAFSSLEVLYRWSQYIPRRHAVANDSSLPTTNPPVQRQDQGQQDIPMFPIH